MIDVIIPSFNDVRLIDVVRDLKNYERQNNVKIFNLIIVDGGSSYSLYEEIISLIEVGDIVIYEKDDGIFDALNKGLDRCTNDFVWWIGTDDRMNVNLPVEDLLGIQNYQSCDIFCFKTCYVNGVGITRSSFSKSLNRRTLLLGLDVAHFSTLCRRTAIGDTRFNLQYRNAADLEFFIKLFDLSRANPVFFDRTLTFMGEGGHTSKNFYARFNNYKEILHIYYKRLGFFGVIPCFNRIIFKFFSLLMVNITSTDKADFEKTKSANN